MKYKELELVPKKKAIKPFRLELSKFDKKYRDYERTNINEELQKKAFEYLKDPKLLEKISKGEEFIATCEKENEAQFFLAQYALEIQKIQEEFLLIYGDELCNLLFENADNINHDPTDEDFEEYFSFLKETLKHFFLKKN